MFSLEKDFYILNQENIVLIERLINTIQDVFATLNDIFLSKFDGDKACTSRSFTIQPSLASFFTVSNLDSCVKGKISLLQMLNHCIAS